VRLWFDFADPVSYALDALVRAQGERVAAAIEWVAFEVAPPPAPLASIDDEPWAARLARARALAEPLGVLLAPPRLVPWTRKAHELHLHARELGKGETVRRAIFEAHFARGEDIGRIDRLVAVAAACGLDAAAAAIVLGLGRHEEGVARARAEAVAAGVLDVPSVEAGRGPARGFHNRDDLLTLFHDAASHAR
jgi:predicted DsbA family dithiol-disulfide isomerase